MPFSVGAISSFHRKTVFLKHYRNPKSLMSLPDHLIAGKFYIKNEGGVQ
jgi:hypothetical protein